MQNSVIDDLIKGKIDKRLSRLGIDDGNATAIGEQLKKYAEKVDGVWLSNARNWDNPELEQLWGAALRKESDRVIVVPGQEKPAPGNSLGRRWKRRNPGQARPDLFLRPGGLRQGGKPPAIRRGRFPAAGLSP